MAIIDAKELAAYIKYKYTEQTGIENIPPIKLQKALYLLLAYWGGFIRKGTINPDFSEICLHDYDEILFDNRIEAWVYGPVVPSVYAIQDSIIPNANIAVDDYIKSFIDELLEDIFKVSDFKLVELTHNDLAWKNNFDYDAEFHNQQITVEEIISEYARR